MSRKKSENPDRPPAGAAPPSASAFEPPHAASVSPLWQTIRSNWMIPLVLLLLWPANWLVHDSGAIDSYQRRIIMLVGVSMMLAVSLQLINGISGQFSLGHAGFMAVGAYLSAYPMRTYDPQNPMGLVAYFIALAAVVGITAGVLFAIFFLIRRSGRLHPVMPSLLLLIVGAWFLVDVARAAKYEMPPAHFVWSRSFALLVDLFDGILAVSLPVANNISTFMPAAARPTLSFLIVLIGGGLCAAVAGLVVGLPTLRLRGDYLAIATLGFAEIIRVVITNSAPLGRATGMSGIPRLANFGWVYGGVIVTILVVWRIARSAKGRNITAVREDEIAAAAIGIDPTRHKVLAFVVGAFLAGVAGGMFAHFSSYLNPQEFGFLRSVEIVVMVTLGGLGSISGAIITAIVLTTLPELLRGFAEWRMIVYAALLIGMMLLRPQGLMGSREIWDLIPRFARRRAPVPSPTTPEGGSNAPP
ncbi:MAG TPA: branched-chain amino acid ABC transporter permease [Tepidisphaeraceae bacterium]|nr:branched-chain amino acid ABC transporter permease [Tepidisphaeraceae bacterium]